MLRTTAILCWLWAVLSPAVALASPDLDTYTSTISSALTDWSGVLTFPSSDPSRTLLQVDLALQGSMDTDITIINVNSDSSTGRCATRVLMTVQDSLGLLSPQVDVISEYFRYSLPKNSSASSGHLLSTNSTTQTYTSAAVLALFAGPAPINLDALTLTQTIHVNHGGNTDAAQMTSAELAGTVTYHYAPIPEPATLALLACGCLLGRIRRFAR